MHEKTCKIVQSTRGNKAVQWSILAQQYAIVKIPFSQKTQKSDTQKNSASTPSYFSLTTNWQFAIVYFLKRKL